MQPDPALPVGMEFKGFLVRKVSELRNLRAVAYELEHGPTGAKLLHVHAPDSENLFCIGFRTPPPDDSGVPHILEHSVLAGSRRFPVKDPFVEMVKMSMATFINAMTYSDKTLYPVASNVRRDFYNLAEVYCDAVFHPNLTENTFKQEGHHLEFGADGGPANPLIVKGIVYNEMKGAFSSPEQVVDRVSANLLFPDTPYGKESGGDPEQIPALTYEDFKRFYQAFYHPSNAYLFLYGDLPTSAHLEFLEQQLSGFSRQAPTTLISRQARWKEPRRHSEPYAISRSEEEEEKTYLTLNWLVGDGTDAREVLAFHLLDFILLGNAAAPLRKALIDSKLGADLTDSGFSGGRLETCFHIGLKGSEPGRAEALATLVRQTLEQVAREGIPQDRLDAAFHQLAYRYNEIKSMFPVWLMERAYSTWIYGADPLVFLRADEILSELRRTCAADPGLLTRLIRERLIENPHRLTCVFTPSPTLSEEKEAAFSRKMAERKAGMTEEEKQRIAAEARELARLQGLPNSEEALATLPQLKVGDLPRKPQEIPTLVESLGSGAELLRNDVFGNGINYLQLDLDLTGLPLDLYRYVALYSDCIHKMGAAGCDYLKMAERVTAHTGSVKFWAEMNYHVTRPQDCLRRARFSLKFLDEKTGEALQVFRDLLFEMDPRDTERLKDVLVMAKAEHRSSLVSHGLDLALRHAMRGLNEAGALAEEMGGLPQTRFIFAQADQFAQKRDETIAKLLELRAFLLSRGGFTASFTGSNPAAQKVRLRLKEWAQAMPRKPAAPAPFPLAASPRPLREGLATAAEIAYCAQAMPAPHLSHPDAPLLNVATRLLSLGYMWEEVRIKGGAYGGGCGYNGTEGTWHFYSYRDPSVKQTLDTFQGLLDHVRKARWTQADLDRAIIGTAKHAERPLRPSAATGTALWRHVNGDTPAERLRRHQAYLGATPKEVKRAVLELLESQLAHSSVCVFSSREMLEEANRQMPAAPLAIEDIP